MTQPDNKDTAAIMYEELTEYVRQDRERFYRIAYTYLRDRDGALDVVQNAILQAFRKLGNLREPRYMRSWFYRILVNESLSELRRRRRRGDEISLEFIDPPEECQDSDRSRDLFEAVRRLPERSQTVVILRYYEELKFDEIARVTRTNVNTVKTRLYQALKELHSEVQK